MVAVERIEGITRRLLTADEVERMVRAGIIRDDDRVELVDGELIEMAAAGGPHVGCVARLTHFFVPRIGDRAIVTVQSTVRMTDYFLPDPDLALLRYRDDFYGGVLPRAEDALLIIEVSDTTLIYDRDTKVPRYAAGVPEAWVVNLRRKQILVYRDPAPDGYRHMITFTRGATLSPLAFPDLKLDWEDVFGRA